MVAMVGPASAVVADVVVGLGDADVELGIRPDAEPFAGGAADGLTVGFKPEAWVARLPAKG